MSDETPHYHGHRGRLRHRFMEGDEAAFPDYELLELLLFYVYPRRDVKPLAKTLLAHFGGFNETLYASPEELSRVAGGTETLAVFFKGLRATAKRMARAEVYKREVLNSWEKVIDYCRLQCRFAMVEEFRLLFLDKKGHLIADELLQRGTIDSAAVYPREVVKRALEVGAVGLIMVHNHPSGDPTPSKADIDVTQRIIEITRPLGISVFDHVIIGKATQFSMKSVGMI